MLSIPLLQIHFLLRLCIKQTVRKYTLWELRKETQYRKEMIKVEFLKSEKRGRFNKRISTLKNINKVQTADIKVKFTEEKAGMATDTKAFLKYY